MSHWFSQILAAISVLYSNAAYIRFGLPNVYSGIRCNLEVSNNCGEDINTLISNPYEDLRKKHFQTLKAKYKDLYPTIEPLVVKRAESRQAQKYEQADELRSQIDAIAMNLLPEGYCISITDIPLREGGGSKWNVTTVNGSFLEETNEKNKTKNNVLQLAHKALGLAIHCSNMKAQGREYDYSNEMNQIVQESIKSLRENPIGLQGRKSADAAFWFALAGVDIPELFDRLGFIAADEIKRFGQRPTCRSVDILNIIERLSAAGVGGLSANAAFSAAVEALNLKSDELARSSLKGMRTLELHNKRSLMFLWHFSTKQRKVKSFQTNAARRWSGKNEDEVWDDKSLACKDTTFNMDWGYVYDDLTKPLVVDIGCGMGVSILGLATIHEEMIPGQMVSSEEQVLGHIDFEQCNFLGADISQLTIGYSRGIAKRKKLGDRVHFVVASAQDIADELANYPGDIELVMLQFPTPFRLVTNLEVPYTGNAQLPKSISDGFMVSNQLLKSIHRVLAKNKEPVGNLLLQSNCEDVAVHMRTEACELGFSFVDIPHFVKNVDDGNRRIPQRTKNWIELGGTRAEGHGWSRIPILPNRGATETEIAYQINNTPIHRCLLKPNRSE